MIKSANAKAEYLQRVYFDKVKIQEVLTNYTGEWEKIFYGW